MAAPNYALLLYVTRVLPAAPNPLPVPPPNDFLLAPSGTTELWVDGNDTLELILNGVSLGNAPKDVWLRLVGQVKVRTGLQPVTITSRTFP